MFQATRLLFSTLSAVWPVLWRAYGWRWPLALVRGLARSRALFRTTHWAVRTDAEARLVRGLTLLPALAHDLEASQGEKDKDVARSLVAAVLDVEARRVAHRAGLASIDDPAERWHAFYEHGIVQGPAGFNESACLSVEADRFHVRVRRCVFAELAREAGQGELGQMLCDLAAPVCARLLPSHDFHRNGPSRCTLAYGHTHCDYVWDRRRVPLAKEATSIHSSSAPGMPRAATSVTRRVARALEHAAERG